MQVQNKRAASDGVLPEIEQARARGAAAIAVAFTGDVLIQQEAAVVGAGTTAPVVPATAFTPLNRATSTTVVAAINGLSGAGATDASLVSIQHSDDNGATWTTDDSGPISALTAAGIGAATTGGAVIAFKYANSGFPIPSLLVPARQFRVVASPVAGNYTTLANQGFMQIHENG
jgi:hypothetical protein